MIAGLDLADPLITFLIILILAVILPEILHSLKITPVPFYILGGILVGPHIAGLRTHEGLDFMADIGLYLLIFLAGLEVFETRNKGFKQSIVFTLFTGSVTAVMGFSLGTMIGWGWEASALLGLVMMSSSVGECIPIINSNNFLKKNFGHIMIPGVIILDGAALLGVGFLVSQREEGGLLTTSIYLLGIILLVLFSALILPRILRMYFKRKRHGKDADFKLVLMVLILVILFSKVPGINGIVPAFMVGIVMGEFVTSKSLYDKLHGIGYGIFIPLFFFVIGMQLDIGVVMRGDFNFTLPFLFVLTLFGSKVIGGMIYANATGRTMREGVLLGITFWPVLSATIAATVIGLKSGIFGQEALISVVVMTVTSTLTTPFVVKLMAGNGSTIKMEGHAVVVGYGRTSSSLVAALEEKGQKCIVIDSNMGKIDRLEKRGIKAVYGNATEREVLQSASIDKARIALITITDGGEAHTCAKLIREMNRSCCIIVQVHTHSDRAALCRENLADFVLWPEKLSAKIALDVVIGNSNVGSWPGAGSQVDPPTSPRRSVLSRGKGSGSHGTHVPDVSDAPRVGDRRVEDVPGRVVG